MTFLAYFFSIVKYVIYGLSIYFTGSLLESTDVLDVLSLRFLLSFFVLFVLKQLKLVKIGVEIKEMFLVTKRKSVMKNVLLAALFEPVLYMLFETMGISGTSGITTGVVLSLIPVASCICEMVVLKENTTIMQKIFLGLGIVGVMYIAFNTNTSDNKDTVFGIICIFLAVVFGALYMVFSRKSSGHFKALEITYTSCFMGMLFFNGANIIRHIAVGDIQNYFAPYFNVQNIIGFVYLGVVSTILATFMNNFALSKIQASTMSAFSGTSTFVTVASGVLLGGEKIYMYHVIGFTLILIRMIGVSYISIKKEKMKNA